ncbi:hypothetical protein CVT25_011520 [Psilocybe cyanescens]|uniref:Uncharacterized protein n=1 Tax=Psilocybe cyanescens TaxID=93625 RepID=A0A409XV46_PSICY|nr:hypothetical protein CVT25_011520 [Psilocybe cyanescens]
MNELSPTAFCAPRIPETETKQFLTTRAMRYATWIAIREPWNSFKPRSVPASSDSFLTTRAMRYATWIAIREPWNSFKPRSVPASSDSHTACVSFPVDPVCTVEVRL